MLTRVLKQTACRLFFFLVGASVASAASLGVSPVRVTLSDSQKMSTITITNRGIEPVIMQLELYSWSQRDNEDVLTATREVLANPPIFTVPAGDSQLVRLGLRRATDPKRELTYRVIMRELPPPPDPNLNGARMLLELSLPVFVLPKTTLKPALLWQAIHTPDGGLKLSLSNIGSVHIQISRLKLLLPGSLQPLTLESSRYVLPGQIGDFFLPFNSENPIPSPGATIQISAQTDVGDFENEVVISP